MAAASWRQRAGSCERHGAGPGLYQSTATLAEDMRRAMETRAVIEQAKGILMVRDQCDDDTAFETLRVLSQRANRKLREIAREIVEGAKTGILPPAEED